MIFNTYALRQQISKYHTQRTTKYISNILQAPINSKKQLWECTRGLPTTNYMAFLLPTTNYLPNILTNTNYEHPTTNYEHPISSTTS